MTELNKPVRRRTRRRYSVLYVGDRKARQIVVELQPGDMLEFRELGRRGPLAAGDRQRLPLRRPDARPGRGRQAPAIASLKSDRLPRVHLHLSWPALRKTSARGSQPVQTLGNPPGGGIDVLGETETLIPLGASGIFRQ